MSFRKTHEEIILEGSPGASTKFDIRCINCLDCRQDTFFRGPRYVYFCSVHKKSVRTTQEESQGKLDKCAAGRQQCFSGVKIQQTLIQR